MKAFPQTKLVEAAPLATTSEAVDEEVNLDLLLLDLRLADTRGLTGLLQRKMQYREIGIVFIPAYAHHGTIAISKLIVASWIIPKTLDRKGLARTIDRAIRGERAVPKVATNSKSARLLPVAEGPTNTINRLIPQQSWVLKLVRDRLVRKQIAHELWVGEKTVMALMREVLRKLNIPSRNQALPKITQMEPS